MRIKLFNLCEALCKCTACTRSHYYWPHNGLGRDWYSHIADAKIESWREVVGSWSHGCKGPKPGLIPGFTPSKSELFALEAVLPFMEGENGCKSRLPESKGCSLSHVLMPSGQCSVERNNTRTGSLDPIPLQCQGLVKKPILYSSCVGHSPFSPLLHHFPPARCPGS